MDSERQKRHRLYLLEANLNTAAFPWNSKCDGLIKRWRTPIPVKTKGVERFERALMRIESEIGQEIFDRNSIAAVDDERVTRGIVVSLGTARSWDSVNKRAIVTEESAGHVSGEPASVFYPPDFTKTLPEISTVLFVNLGSPKCDDSKKGADESDIAAHELAHALGLQHFHPAFSDREGGEIVSADLWRILRIVYEHPIGTPMMDVRVEA